jgi:hypothetical protein
LNGSATTFGGFWNYFGGDDALIAITATPIPEPSTYAVLAGLLALGLVMLRRRRA